jgi:hypothetical protein
VLQREHLVPGRYRFSIQCEGHVGPAVDVDLGPGRLTDLGQVVVVAPFHVRLALHGGADAGELSCSLSPLEPPGHAAFHAASYRLSARNGEASADIAPGRYRLRATGKGVGALLMFDTRQLGDAPLVVELHAESELRVDSTKLAAPARLLLTNPAGDVLSDRWVTWQGRWSLQLPAGSYRWSLRGLDGAERAGTVTVGGDPATLALQ